METYSQRGQDRFAIDFLRNKHYGTFLDFGCKGPIDINNTYLLEKKYNFKGLSFDIDKEAIDEWKNTDRDSENAICVDLMSLEIKKTLDEFYINGNIDYFSFDLEPPLLTLDVLKKFPFDSYQFGIVTYEHDYYRGFDTLIPSREIFSNNGYKKVTTDVMNTYDVTHSIFLSEDWWFHPDLVSVPPQYIDTTVSLS
jgi:hypothetical protein